MAAADAAAGGRRRLRRRIEPLLPGLVALWGVGVLAALGALARRLAARAAARRARACAAAPAGLEATLARLRAALRVSAPVRLSSRLSCEVPTVVGWLRPVILLPAAPSPASPPQQLELILAHELAHVRRHDYLVNLLQTAVETLLFYHPAVWWVSHRMRVEREHCCDDLAVAACGDAVRYARALAELEGLVLGRAGAGDGRERRLAASSASRGSSGARRRAVAARSAALGGAGRRSPASRSASASAAILLDRRSADVVDVPRRRAADRRRPPTPTRGDPPRPRRRRSRKRPRRARAGAAGPAASRREPPARGARSARFPLERVLELARAGRHAGVHRRDGRARLPVADRGAARSRCARQGVGPEYVRELAGAGYAEPLRRTSSSSCARRASPPDFVAGAAASRG